MSTFQKNLKAVIARNPQLASQLASIKKNSKFEVFLDEKDSLNINIVDKKNFTPMYKTKPANEIEDRFKDLDKYKRYPYLYFFGLGNGVLYKALLQNPQHLRILVVEPEIEIIYIVLNLLDFSEDISNGRIVIERSENIGLANSLYYFTEKNVKIFSKLYNLIINCDFYNSYREDLLSVNMEFAKIVEHVVINLGNDSIDALIGLKHHISNLPKMINTPTFLELTNKAKVANAAVLVSTGPSLSKQLKLLKEIENSVAIVAVDASLPVLYKNDIKPDIVVSMERELLTVKFFKDTPKEAHEGVIFALSSLQQAGVISNIKAGTKQISMRPFGYTKATGPDAWGYVGIGMSAANMAYEIIYYSGFDQCILIGQDLAYANDGSSHADGHIFSTNEVKEKATDSYVTKYGGDGAVKTTYVWNMFRNFFETDISHTKDKMLTINATEGGARIHGALELSFEKAIEKYVDKDKQKTKINLEYLPKKELEEIKLEVQKKIKHIKKYTKEKTAEVKTLFLAFAKECEKIDKLDLDKQLDKIDFDKLNLLNTKLEKIKNYFDDKEFVLIFIDAIQSFIIHQEMEIAKIVVRDIQNEDEKKLKMVDWIKAHKFWLFSLAGCMDAVVKTVDYASVRSLIDEVETVGVYCGKKKIDSIKISDMKAENGRVFDADMRGILYDAPDEYQDRLMQIVFKDAKSDKELPKAFVDVIARDDEKYNELSFMQSLEEPISEEMKDMYCPNSIGFLATEENLEDVEFVGYIKELMVRFPDVEFKGFCFNQEQKQLIQQKLTPSVKSIETFLIKSIYEIAEKIEIYLYRQKQGIDRALYVNLIKHSMYIACLDSTNLRQSIQEADLLNSQHRIFEDYDLFNMTQDDIAIYQSSYTRLIYEKIRKEVSSEVFQLDMNSKLFYRIDRVDWILHIDGFKEQLIKTFLSRILK